MTAFYWAFVVTRQENKATAVSPEFSGPAHEIRRPQVPSFLVVIHRHRRSAFAAAPICGHDRGRSAGGGYAVSVKAGPVEEHKESGIILDLSRCRQRLNNRAAILQSKITWWGTGVHPRLKRVLEPVVRFSKSPTSA